MMGWWRNLSAREQVMVAVGGGIFALFFLLQFVLTPIVSWRSEAKAKESRARDGYELVLQAAAMEREPGAQAAQAATPIRSALTQTAAASNIDLIRVGTEVDGQIELQLGAVEADTLYKWIEGLQVRFGIVVAFADISRADDGAVNAQVLIFERSQQ